MTLLLAAAAFVAGTGLGYHLVAGASPVAGAATVAAAALIAACCAGLTPAPGRRHLRWVLAAVLAAGALRGYLATGHPVPLPGELHTAREAVLEGVLGRDARSYGDGYALTLHVDRYLAEESWRPARFIVDVVSSQLSNAGLSGRAPDGFQAGDRYLVSGELASAAWSPAASRGSSAVVERAEVSLLAAEPVSWRRWLGQVRGELARSIDRTSPEPAAGLIKALVTGNRSGLSPGTRDAFRRSGTSHILAISGLHVGIFAAMSVGAAAWLMGRRRQLYLLVPGAAVWGYAVLAGLTPPVTRAAIMASILIGGRVLGRQRSAGPALGLAAAAMVGLDPSLLADVSFQLSFLAIAGVVFVTPGVELAARPLLDRVGRHIPGNLEAFLGRVVSGVAMSVGAVSMTAPVVAVRFDALSAWGIPATLLQVPALPFLIVLGALQALVGLVWQPLGVATGLPTWGLATYVFEVAEGFARLPGGAIRPSAPVVLGAGAYYLALVAAIGRGGLRHLAPGVGTFLARFAAGVARAVDAVPARPRAPHRAAPRPVVFAVLMAAGLAWAGALGSSGGTLRVTFFETDGGDSILISTPAGRQVLIDGGDSAIGAVRALGSRMPFWDRSIDLVVLTHPHADHARGLLAVLERYRVQTILDSPSSHDSAVYGEWLERAGSEGARRIEAVPGAALTLDRDVRMEVLLALSERTAPDPNDRSIVLRLVYGEASFLFTGDLSMVAERLLLGSGAPVQATVLKVGHQGSRGSTSDAFLEAVRPSLAVVPASIGNRYGHPHAETLERIARHVDADRVLVTMHRGTVDIETDGRSYRARTAR